jgi:hypothetical protein
VDAHRVWQRGWRDSARVCRAQNVELDTPSVPPVAAQDKKSTPGAQYTLSCGNMFVSLAALRACLEKCASMLPYVFLRLSK